MSVCTQICEQCAFTSVAILALQYHIAMTGLPIVHSHNEIRDAINGKLVYYIQICTYIVHSNIYIYMYIYIY